MLELALIVPILVLLIMAIFQFAYVIESQMGLTNAVREAGRRVAAQTDTTPDWGALQTWVESELCGDTTPPCDAGLLPANVSGFDPASLTGDLPTVTFCSYDVVGSSGAINNYQVNVSLTYEHPIFFALLDFATDALDGTPNNRWDLSVSAQMRLEYVDDADPGFTSPGAVCPTT